MKTSELTGSNQQRNHEAACKKKEIKLAIRQLVHAKGYGMSRKEILRNLPARTPANEVDHALASLVDESALIRSGGVGAGYRYWPGN